jgi:hypothetical protein
LYSQHDSAIDCTWIGALHEAGEPFVNVSVELMTRDDGSGAFTHRFINDLDPTITDGEPVAAATWTITGGSELDATGRDGDSRPPEPSRQVSIYNGTGTITNGQSAPAHNGTYGRAGCQVSHRVKVEYSLVEQAGDA